VIAREHRGDIVRNARRALFTVVIVEHNGLVDARAASMRFCLRKRSMQAASP
jgi:hypothetical protein